MRRALPAALAAAVLALTACGPGEDVALPGAPDIDVDTPRLRELKREAGVEDCVPGTGRPVEGGLPAVTLPCLGGGPDVDLSALRGPLVVSLWAGWCGPCRDEMPVLQAFHAEHGGRVPVLGIDYEDPQTERALELVRETGVTYPLLADPAAELNAADPFPVIRGLPMLALVDAQGRIAHRDAVVIESQDELEDLVAEHLGVGL